MLSSALLVATLILGADAGTPQAPNYVTGGLGKDVIARVIRGHGLEVRDCYERQLAQQPKLSGKVSVAFKIGPDGSVTSAEIADDELQAAAVSSCLLTAVKSWKFPEPAGGGTVAVTFPWTFKPKG